MKHVLIGLSFIILVVCGSSCVRYRTTTTHTRDTLTVLVNDTVVIKPDTVALIKVEKTIDSVFVEIEKDCPNIKTSKSSKLKAVIKESCTHESLSGGSIIVWSAKLKQYIIIKFKGNNGIAELSESRDHYVDKINNETVKELSIFSQIINTWFMWVPGLVFFLLWALSRFSSV